jgi:hypothetical protein
VACVTWQLCLSFFFLQHIIIIGLNSEPAGLAFDWAFQERGGGGAGAAADGADRVPDEVGGRDPGRRLQVEEVRQEVRQEQPQPKVSQSAKGIVAHPDHRSHAHDKPIKSVSQEMKDQLIAITTRY